MADRRVDPTERPRDDHLYVARIGEDKKEKEKYTQLPQDENKTLLLATFFSYLKKMFDTFSPSKKIAGKVVDIQKVIEHLQTLKNLLKKLQENDLSTSSEYALTLSSLWIEILEDFDTIEIMHRKNLKELFPFREMIDTIKNHPPDSEHRFGYYLLQQAGKDWLPFPFIEILENLHKNHLEKPNSSTLILWQTKINAAINTLKQGISFKGF